MKWIRQLYDWVIRWSDSKHSQKALFLIALVEACVFPIPPDVLLIAMGVGASKKSFRFALICLTGSLLGGLIGYAIGHALWSGLSDFFFAYVPGFTPEIFNKVSGVFHENAFMAVFLAGFTPIPYKVFTIAAGAAEIPLWIFLIASLSSRGLRFFAISAALYFVGPTVKQWIDRYFNLITIIFGVLLIGGFVLIKFMV